MFDKPQASHTLGLELDGSVVRAVGLAYSRGNPVLEAILSFSLENHDGDVKPLYNDKEKLIALAYKHLVVSLLPPQDVLIRPLELNLKKESDIDSVLSFQTEPMLPFPIESALVDKIILEKNKERTKMSIAAARKDRLQQHLETWENLDIQPEVVSAAPAALALFAKLFSQIEHPHFVFHAGINNSLCILVDKGKLLAAQSLTHGLNELAEAFAKDTNSSNESAMIKLKEFSEDPSLLLNDAPLLKAAIDNFRIALTRTIYALTKQLKGQEVQEILLTGECCSLSWLATSLANAPKRQLLFPKIPPNFSSANLTIQQIQTNALPIGAALCALPRCQDQINFRQAEFSYPDPWKRLKLPVLLYLTLCLGIAASLVLLGKTYAHYQEAELKKEYLELLHTINIPYTVFEKEIAKKNSPTKEFTPSEIPSLTSMTPDMIANRLNFLEKDIQSTPQTFPLQPNVPLVSDVLAWISTHPAVLGTPNENNLISSSLKIENFSYTLLKRPELSKKQEKYQVKVELEFTSPTPKMAREFHDALITPNDIIDPKGEIKWNAGKDRYRTSFYLKDRTIYTN